MATDLQTLLDLDDAYKRGRRRGALVTLAVSLCAALLAFPVYWALQRYVILHDDYVRGENVSDMAAPTPEGGHNPFCERLAEALYGHGLFVAGNEEPGQGFAPRNEKAFYAGCTGQPFPQD